MSDDVPGLTQQQLLLFGTVIQWFARYEVLMQEIMATVSGADVTAIKLLTVDLDFIAKRNALFRMLRYKALPHDHVDQIQSYFQVVDAFLSLRNDIAHSIWVKGTPQNSIWPLWLTHGPLQGIKPSGAEGSAPSRDETIYSVEDLTEVSRNIAANFAGLSSYVAGLGLVTAPAPQG